MYTFTTFDHLLAYGKTESEVYSTISVNDRKPKIAMELKPDFQVNSKWFIGNVVPHGSPNDFVHPLQSLSLYSLLNDWRINIGYVVLESMRAACAPISCPNPPDISKISLHIGCSCLSFAHFNTPIYHSKQKLTVRTIFRPYIL